MVSCVPNAGNLGALDPRASETEVGSEPIDHGGTFELAEHQQLDGNARVLSLVHDRFDSTDRPERILSRSASKANVIASCGPGQRPAQAVHARRAPITGKEFRITDERVET